MPPDVLARRLSLPGDLPQPMIEAAAVDRGRAWTAEQLLAIERREGDLLLDASAGSGKTSVLVERFVRSVLQDGIEVGAILTITFTEKAAAEMRDRIRVRLRALGADDAARATEGAFISTIHGFCARLLRAQALAAGLDPAFVVLDAPDAERLAAAAFDDALERLAAKPAGVELIASYGAGALGAAIRGVHAELRSRGETEPVLPSPPPAPAELEDARGRLAVAVRAAIAELAAVAEPGARVVQALDRLERCDQVLDDPDPWPGRFEALTLPGNGPALASEPCVSYAEALERFRVACEHQRAARVLPLLDGLLRDYGARYAHLKRDRSAVDFEDLELIARDLLRRDSALRDRYAARFERIMVDELQDTNAVQLELIESISCENLFTVGDAMQSIYAFRHADVELFERRGARLAAVGARATLERNFRARGEILEVINRAFDSDNFRPLVAGRSVAAADDPRVELIVADKGADWREEDSPVAPWRLAEARALARRLRELVDGGASVGEIVVLTRATTDLRAYERALEEHGIPTYLIGGRGYWSHPQVLDLVCYLRALANPLDEEAVYTVLLSPLVGASVDALVVLAAVARERGSDPWRALREGVDGLSTDDRGRLGRFASWFAGERALAARAGIEELIERAVELTGYDLAVLAMPGGRRRLANVRKLMRFAHEYDGSGLRGFLDELRGRALRGGFDATESEAPVEGDALDAVRLMTIHRAKGLEFEIVCVADLGRGPRARAELLRVGRDGRIGLRLAEPGTGRRVSSLDYRALGEERAEADAREERRLFYVAMTRARERLIVSGAARAQSWTNGGAGPIAWLGPALVPDLSAAPPEIKLTVCQPTDVAARACDMRKLERPRPVEVMVNVPERVAPAPPAPPVRALSYSTLEEYKHCGYRFYVERVLGVPGLPASAGSATGVLTATERGLLVHALLERLDFRRPLRPTPAVVLAAAERALDPADVEDVAALVERFGATELCARLARATRIQREQRFAFPLGEVLVTGAIDVLAREPRGMLVVDYKTDRLMGATPAAVAETAYATQRLVYALAAIRAGAAHVEIAHTFLEAPERPAIASFERADAAGLGAELATLAAGVLERDFRVTEAPERGVCGGCPAEGGLCSWPLSMTRRDAPNRLF